MSEVMKASWFERFGTAAEVLVVGEQPRPQPAAGEVLVRVHASGINPSDVKKRAGSAPDLLDGGLVIPHSDGAGVIAAVGAGVSERRLGERVWIYQAQYERSGGTAAQYLAIDSRRAVYLPDEIGFDVGACIGIPVMTAHRCVFADGPVDGQTILVTGGAGRVGYYTIAWAVRAGAKVIATASNDADTAVCLQQGATVVVNHREDDWPTQLLAANGGERVDRVIEVDFGGNLPAILDVIKTSGTIATYASMSETEPKLPFYRMMFMDLTVRLVVVYAMPESAKDQAIGDITSSWARQPLNHRIAHELALEDIVKAHELVEQGGFKGCVVLSI